MSCIFLQEDIDKLFTNKHVVVMGGSIQRSVYKDFVRLLQGNVYLKDRELRLKGEPTILNDKLIYKSQSVNGPQYREEREYITDHHYLKFIFLTRCYNSYVESVLEKFKAAEIKPDVIIINSCLWDLTSYGGGGRNDASAINEYKENLETMFTRFKQVLPECLCIWSTNPPIAKDCKGGVFVPGTEELKSCMGLHLLEANAYSRKLAVSHGFDVIDLYYFLMHHVHRRAEDGIHWDMSAHRRITNIILSHISEAWEIELPKHLENVVSGNMELKEKVVTETKSAVAILQKMHKPFEFMKENEENENVDIIDNQQENDEDFHTKFMKGEHTTPEMTCLSKMDENCNYSEDPQVVNQDLNPPSLDKVPKRARGKGARRRRAGRGGNTIQEPRVSLPVEHYPHPGTSNFQEHYPPQYFSTHPPRNPYAEDRYSSSIAADCYHQGPLYKGSTSHWAGGWGPHQGYHPKMSVPMHRSRYMPYARHPPPYNY